MSAPRGNETDKATSPVATRVLTGGLSLALLALFFLSRNSTVGLKKAAAEEQVRDAMEIAFLHAENSRLAGRTPLAAPKETSSTAADSARELGVRRMEALSLLSDLSERGFFATPSPMSILSTLARPDSPNLKKTTQPAYMIEGGGALSPGFAEFFGLNHDEELSLQTGLAAWKEEVERVIQANTTVTKQEDGSVVLEVRRAEGAGDFRERFTTLLREGLGADRFRAFAALNSGRLPAIDGTLPTQLNGNLNFFGEGEGTYTLKYTPTSYSVRFNIRTGDGVSSGSVGGGISLTPEEMRKMLVKTHGPIMKLLPADF